MYFLLSPAKNLDDSPNIPLALDEYISTPALIEQSFELIKTLKTHDVIDTQELMKVSGKIAQLTVNRHQAWVYPFDERGKPAVYLFNGDVYTGLQAKTFNQDEMLYLNQHLGILSGLYGILKPLDNILPYRLEMGTKLKTSHHDDLYTYWGNSITDIINQRIIESGSDILINLASDEYFRSVNTKNINATIITPKFLDYKNGDYKIISFYAKKARGMMMNFATRKQITNPKDLQSFCDDGYYFDSAESSKTVWVFKRNQF